MSNPTHPIYTFRINLQTLQNTSWLQPYTSGEGTNMKNTRSTWLCNYFPGSQFIANKDAFEFTAYGLQAQYLKDLYCHNLPDDVLTLVS